MMLAGRLSCHAMLELRQDFVTERLALRCLRPGDTEYLFRLIDSDQEVTRYFEWESYSNIDQTRHRLKRRLQAMEKGKEISWLIVLKDDQTIIGQISLNLHGHKAELGFALGRPYWKCGYMTEAARTVVDWALAQDGLYRLWAVTDCENIGALSVLERAGFTREGVLKAWAIHPNISSIPRACVVYAKIKV